MSFEWTDAAAGVAKAMWLEGSSARQIARRLGQGVSRCAVIGKLRRLGLRREAVSSPGARPPKPARTPQAQRTITRPRRRGVDPAIVNAVTGARAARAHVVVLAPANQGARLADLRHGQCRFPLDDPGPGQMHRTRFCAGPAAEGETYCPHHARVCFAGLPAPPRRQAA